MQHSQSSRSSTGRPQWLVLFNCQAMGLANCLSLLSNKIRVEHYGPETFAEKKSSVLANLRNYERVLIAPGLDAELDTVAGKRENVWYVPPLYFSGYHPDICYLSAKGPLSKGPLGHYHSAIAYAAFRCGYDESETLSLFNEKTYLSLGYFDRWDVDRNRILDVYTKHGFDMELAFVKWSRNAPFMHSVNHPKIASLHELARAVLTRAGLTSVVSEHLPHDNLTNGPVFPIYPEIGSQLGVSGSYQFKPAASYQLMALPQFIEESFRVYRLSSDAEPDMKLFFPMLENAIAYVKALA